MVKFYNHLGSATFCPELTECIRNYLHVNNVRLVRKRRRWETTLWVYLWCKGTFYQRWQWEADQVLFFWVLPLTDITTPKLEICKHRLMCRTAPKKGHFSCSLRAGSWHRLNTWAPRVPPAGVGVGVFLKKSKNVQIFSVSSLIELVSFAPCMKLSSFSPQ